MKSLNEQFTESMYLVTHAWRNELDRRLRPLGFSHSRWLLLLHLSRQDGCTHSELAQSMGIEAATLVRAVDHMERIGLLERCGSETDRRVKHLHLTEDGKTMVKKIRTYTDSLRKELLDGLDQDKVGTAVEVLNTIRNKLGIPA
ncbi:MAG: MarR family transcriptional regulator [Nitrosomonadales bacterium]|nr:MarR family transcriptional regulator [Nitrosomonadales bacterium]